MKKLKLIAVALAAFVASTATAEVVSKVYDFENYEPGPIDVLYHSDLNGGANLKPTVNDDVYATIKDFVAKHEGYEKYLYNDKTGCIAVSIVNTALYDKWLGSVNVIDFGGTTGKALAIAGGGTLTEVKNDLKNLGLNTEITGSSEGIAFWGMHFFLDPEQKLTGKIKVTITTSILHHNNVQAIQNVYIKSGGTGAIKTVEGSEFQKTSSGHDGFAFDEWSVCSFVADVTNKNAEMISIHFNNQENFYNSLVLIKSIVVESTEEDVTAGNVMVVNPAFYSVGMAFTELNKVVKKGQTASTELKYTVGEDAVTYTSDNEAVATVAADGTITGKSYGTAVITAKKAGNPDARCTVFVTDPEVKSRTFCYDIDDVMPTYDEVELTHYGTWWHGGYIGDNFAWKNGHLDTDSKCSFTVKTKEGYEIDKVVMEGEESMSAMFEVEGKMDAAGEGTTRTFTVPEGKYLTTATFSPEAAVTKINTVTVDYKVIVAPDHESYVLNHELGADQKSVTFTAGHPSHTLYHAIYTPEAASVRAKAPALSAAQDYFSSADAAWETSENGHVYVYAPAENAQAHFIGVKAKDTNGKESPVTIYEVAANGTMTTGLGNVTVDDVPAVYYNLQGVRVEGAPEAGLYIEVKGNTARKVRF